MSFTRFRKSEKNKASSVQGSQDYVESVHQQDNLSQYSHNSNKQYVYQQNQFFLHKNYMLHDYISNL